MPADARKRRGTLIYDGECSVCRTAADWVDARAARDQIECLTCQDPSRATRFPDMPEDDCMRAVQYVSADGVRYEGADALPQILLSIRGWRWMARLLRLPLISAVSPIAYAFFARNRHMFAILVAEKHRDATCAEDDCETD